tara:strand:+ start:35 stop:472 length:438 start_codon:yes stop_codon:yes gene_type:complete
MKQEPKIQCKFTDRQLRNINGAILIYLHKLEQETTMSFDEHPLIQSYLKIHDYIDDLRQKEKSKPEKTEHDPFDPYKRKYYARKGFYQQLTAADMMGLKSESSLVSYRKKGVLKENIHWIRTVGRGISYNPEKCKLAIRKAKLGY